MKAILLTTLFISCAFAQSDNTSNDHLYNSVSRTALGLQLRAQESKERLSQKFWNHLSESQKTRITDQLDKAKREAEALTRIIGETHANLPVEVRRELMDED